MPGPLPLLIGLTLAFQASVFVCDLLTPSDVATAVLHLVPVVGVAMWTPPTIVWALVVIASVSTLLTVAAFMATSSVEAGGEGLVNLVLVLSALWGIVIVSLIRKGVERESRHVTR